LPLTANERAFRVLVRNAMFRRVELVARNRPEELALLEESGVLDTDAWAQALESYYAEYDFVGTGPDARGPHLLVIEKAPERWLVQQIVDDPEGHHDWRLFAEVDLGASDAAGELVLTVTGLSRMP